MNTEQDSRPCNVHEGRSAHDPAGLPRKAQAAAARRLSRILPGHDPSAHRSRHPRREGLPRRRRHGWRRRLDGRGLARRAGQPGHDRGCRGRRRRVAEPPPCRPELVRRQGQGGGARRGQARDRLRRARRRRRAVAGPAARARGAAQRQGHRPQPADPRHLRPPRPDPRRPAPGRARPARVPAAAPDPAVDAPESRPAAGSGPGDRARASSRPTGGSSGPGSRR